MVHGGDRSRSLAALEELAGIGGDDLVLLGRGDNADRHMVLAGEKETFPYFSREKQVLFSLREVKNFFELVDGAGTLFHEDLNTTIVDDGFAKVATQEIFDVLSNGGKPEVVFAGPLGDGVEEARRVLVFHEIPGLVNHEQAFFEVALDLGPDVIKDDKDGGRPELVL